MTPDQSRGIPDDAALVEPYPDERICTTCEGEGAVLRWSDLPGYSKPHTEHLVGHMRRATRTLREGTRFCSCAGNASTWQIDTCLECGRGREVGRL